MSTYTKINTPPRPLTGRRRHLVILPLLLLACAAFFAWAAYSFLPPAEGAFRRQIVNDDYSTLTAPLAVGDEMIQDLVVQGRIYGVILDVSTFGRVPRGTLHLRLLGENGGVVSACNADMSQLLDNTFHRFLFDVAVNGGSGTSYRLSITASPESPQDTIAFHKSDGPANFMPEHAPGEPLYSPANFSLTQNNQTDSGTLALQYITRYADDTPARLFALLAALFTVLALLAYCLLLAFRFSLRAVVAAACLLLGLCFILLLPAHAALPKGPLADVYHYSSVLLGQGGQDSMAGLLSSTAVTGPDGAIFAREQDAFLFQEHPLDVFAWQDQLQGLPDRGNGAVLVETTRAGIPPVFTAPMVLVFGLCRLLGVPGLIMVMAARVLNLLLYAATAFLALRRMPLARPLLAALFLLPASLQAAVSFTGEGLALALVLLFCATLLRRWEKHPRWEWQKAPLLVILALCFAGLVFGAMCGSLAMQGPVSVASAADDTAFTYGASTYAVYSSNASTPDAFLSALVGGAWGGAPAAGLNWLFLLALAGLCWALSLPALGAQRPFGKKTRLAAGAGAALFALSALLPALLLSAMPDPAALLPACFLLLVALRGRNLAFARDASRPLLLAFILLGTVLCVNFFVVIVNLL